MTSSNLLTGSIAVHTQGASKLKEPESLFFTDLALSDATQYGIQLIEL
jgi:hypothetical protein